MYMGVAMDSTVLPTIAGSVASGLTSIAFSFFGQKVFNSKREQSKLLASRERLYSQFIKEVAAVYTNSLDGAPQKASSLVPVYSLVNQMRLVSTNKVVQAAEKVTEEILDSFDRPIMTIQEIRKITKERNSWPMREFTEACRLERQDGSCL